MLANVLETTQECFKSMHVKLVNSHLRITLK